MSPLFTTPPQYPRFRPRPIWLVICLGLIAVSVQAQEPVPPAHPSHQLIGVGSCAAAGCHGGDGSRTKPDGSFNFSSTSYSTWVQQDSHARAYDVLLTDKSRQIIRQLGAGWQAAHQDRRCLACHSSVASAAGSPANEELLLDGVSCEACHGPAEKWLIPHTEHTWRDGKPADARRASLGFVDLRTDLELRGKTCAKCHVGGPGRDVNHDLIAAGHPRLNFELSAYHSNMPAHWNTTEDQQAFPVKDQPQGSALEAKLWVIGQLTTADAALNLLEARAGTAAKAAWPEFAEYGCYACHHDLQAPSWRQENLTASRKPGSYPWGTWNFPLLTVLDPPKTTSPLTEALKKLEVTMGHPNPVRVEVVIQAMVARELIGSELKLHSARDSMTVERIRQLLQRVTQDGRDLSKRDWDAAAQVYLATVALHQGHLQANPQTAADPQVLATLETLRGELKFPEGPVKFASPRSFDKQRIKDIGEQLQKLEQLVKRP